MRTFFPFSLRPPSPHKPLFHPPQVVDAHSDADPEINVTFDTLNGNPAFSGKGKSGNTVHVEMKLHQVGPAWAESYFPDALGSTPSSSDEGDASAKPRVTITPADSKDAETMKEVGETAEAADDTFHDLDDDMYQYLHEQHFMWEEIATGIIDGADDVAMALPHHDL